MTDYLLLSGFVFFCSNETEQECVDKLLFGNAKKHWKLISETLQGTTLLADRACFDICIIVMFRVWLDICL